MWLANEACLSFVCVPVLCVEGSSARRIEVRCFYAIASLIRVVMIKPQRGVVARLDVPFRGCARRNARNLSIHDDFST
jgi:hypothetical protein